VRGQSGRRTAEIDTTGPGFGFEQFKAHDFIEADKVVLTFDDGLWIGHPPAAPRGAMVYFGYPLTRTKPSVPGWRFYRSGQKLRIEEPFQVRIGVATGLLVVGSFRTFGARVLKGIAGPAIACGLRSECRSLDLISRIARRSPSRGFVGPPGYSRMACHE
jgi:hypothetical protein